MRTEDVLALPKHDRLALLRHAKNSRVRRGSLDDVVHAQSFFSDLRFGLDRRTAIEYESTGSLDDMPVDNEPHITYDPKGVKRPEDGVLTMRDGSSTRITVSSVVPMHEETGELHYGFHLQDLPRTYSISLPPLHQRGYLGSQPRLALSTEFTVHRGELVWPKVRLTRIVSRPCVYDDDDALEKARYLPDHMKLLLSAASESRPSRAVQQMLGAQALIMARFFKQQGIAGAIQDSDNEYNSVGDKNGRAYVNASWRTATNIFNMHQAAEWLLNKPVFNHRTAEQFSECISNEVAAEYLVRTQRHRFLEDRKRVRKDQYSRPPALRMYG